jgi:hypothetical protein
MLNVCTLLWDPNGHSYDFSRCYDETWVEKLYREFDRNLSRPFRFVCFTDRDRSFEEPIEQERLSSPTPGYGHCIEPFRLGEPMILVGLDTIVIAGIDHFADYCMSAEAMALPRNPDQPRQSCNAVCLVPKGWKHVADEWKGGNDMAHLRKYPTTFIDDLWPGQVLSYKRHVKKTGLGDARIVYFHGQEKPHQIGDDFVKAHWR